MQDTIAIIFDFDDTLAPDSSSSFLESLGVDVKAFWTKTVQDKIDNGWDPIPAYLHEMIQLANCGGPNKLISREKLQRFGKQMKLSIANKIELRRISYQG